MVKINNIDDMPVLPVENCEALDRFAKTGIVTSNSWWITFDWFQQHILFLNGVKKSPVI